MAESKKHKEVSENIAQLKGVDYNNGKGADIITPSQVIEVETANSVSDGLMQLQGYRKPSYIAGTDEKAVKKALDLTKNTTIGVMDKQGRIRKRSTRKRR